MNRILKISGIALLALVCMVPAASAQGRGFGGGFRGGFGGGFRGGFGVGLGYYGPGWFYGPGFYGPYGYGYYGGYNGEGSAYGTGHVKLDLQAKDALVYVDGGYAGLSGKLKNFPLKAGNHTIELRDPSGHTFYQERLNVLPGRTVDVHADTPSPNPGK